jgi:hypothetical protein
MEQRQSNSRPIRVCYYMQTHARPGQIERLVRVIKSGCSPESVVVVHHDSTRVSLDVDRFESLPGVYVIQGPGGYGDFSHIERYFAAVDWMEERAIAYDWLENMTGQDYPLRPIAEIEQIVAASGVDGFLQYTPLFPERMQAGADWGAGPDFRLDTPFNTSMRYEYNSWRIGRPTPGKQRWLRPIMALNLIQPWVRVSLAFSTIGIRRRDTIFNDDFILYGGSFFCTLSASCVRYARDFARENPEVVEFFKGTLAPDEVFLHTVLVNSGKFRFIPDGKRYIDFKNSRNNHPKVFSADDVPVLLKSGAHWARKFDTSRDPDVLDMLDAYVLKS